MPESTRERQPPPVDGHPAAQVADRVRDVAVGLTTLLREAEEARRLRAEVARGDEPGAVCAWNHFENIPTFYNWNNRPR